MCSSIVPVIYEFFGCIGNDGAENCSMFIFLRSVPAHTTSWAARAVYLWNIELSNSYFIRLIHIYELALSLAQYVRSPRYNYPV